MVPTNPSEILRRLFAAGETQKSIEEATGVSQATISRIHTGEHKDPRSSTVRKLSEYASQRLQGEDEGAEPSVA